MSEHCEYAASCSASESKDQLVCTCKDSTPDNTIDIYHIKINEWINFSLNNQYIFEITKCCGYSAFITTYKDITLTELYINLNYHGSIYNNKLYVKNSKTNELMPIPNYSNMTIRNFILDNRDYFTPVYPLPLKVVYTIYMGSECSSKCSSLG